MQKTIKEWLSELPEPYRSKALANAKNEKRNTLNDKEPTLEQAVCGGFTWVDSPEGREYWQEISEGKYPVILTTLPPTCAIEALMIIALKKGFPVEDIMSVKQGLENWHYQLKGNEEWFTINLKTDIP